MKRGTRPARTDAARTDAALLLPLLSSDGDRRQAWENVSVSFDGDRKEATSHRLVRSSLNAVLGWIGIALLVLVLGAESRAAAPGGVSVRLEYWSKADDGISAVTDGTILSTWDTLLGNDDFLAVGGGATHPIFKNNPGENINFNPSIDFDGIDDYLALNAERIEDRGRYSFLAVGVREDAGVNPVLAVAPEDFFFGYQSALQFGLQSVSVTGGYLNSGFGQDVPAVTPFLLAGFRDAIFEERNGVLAGGAVGSNWRTPDSLGALKLGSDDTGNHFNGRLSEILIYRTELTPSELMQVKSYLAMKYGISLGQNQGAQNYVSSTGAVIWDAAVVGTSYNKDITAIGQDDGSALDQTQSKSTNHESLVTIAENGGGMSDGEFLFWSNDGGSRAFETTELPSSIIVPQATAGVTHRLGREWLVKETGEVGSVDLSFDLTGISIPAGVDLAEEFLLLYDGDGDFSIGSSQIRASSFTGTVVTFTGLSESVLNDGTYFTLGATVLSAPAGISSSGMELWLKADAGTSTTTNGAALASWSDQSGRGTPAIQGQTPISPVYQDNESTNINFHPTIAFDGSDDSLVILSEGLEGSSNYSIIAVGIRADGSVNAPVGSELAKEAFFYGYNSSQEFGFRALAGGSSIDFSNSPSAFDMPGLTPFLLSGINSELREERNGATSLSAVNSNGAFPNAGSYYIGRQGSEYFNGRLSELLVFRRALNATEQVQLSSYLAMKYGISLGQGGGGQNYVSSTGAVIWNAGVVGNYNKDITAIGQDDGSALDQTQSKSTNHESLVTIAENGGGMSDGEFLFWSNDGGSRAFETTEVPSGATHRLGREWLVEETGEVGSVDLSFDLSGISIPSGVDLAEEFLLLYDGDGDFSSGSSQIRASSFTGTVVTFTGLSESVLNDGTYFTLGATALIAPAGLISGIELWLKADAGTSTTTDGAALASWSDQSGRGSDGSESDSLLQPVYQNNDNANINFHPTIAFDGSDDQLLSSLSALEGSSNYSIIAVGLREDGSVNAPLGSDLAKEAFFYGYNSSQEFGFRALEGGTSISFSSPSSAFDVPGLTPFLLSGINSELREERNGATSLSAVNTNGTFPNVGQFFLGRQGTEYFNGRLSELVVFSRALNATEQAQLSSYLAMKYGISLGQNDGAQSYVSSTGAVIWDAAVVGTSYNKDITAIGQDDGSELDQTQSKSTNHESLVTISENGGGMSDGEFLFWSNDGGSRSFETTEVPSGATHRLGREWLVEETGEVGSVDLSFDLSGISIPSGVDVAGEFSLLYDADGDFTSGSSRVSASSFTGTVVTFTGLPESVLNDGTYFTLGATVLNAPAGVSFGIKLWLKADAGTTTDGSDLVYWFDSTGSNSLSFNTTGQAPVYQDNESTNINFHPTVAFDGVDDHLTMSKDPFGGSNNYSILAVGIREDGSVNPVIGSDLAKEAFFYGYNSSQEFGFRALAGGSSIDFSNSPSAFDMPGLTPFLLSGINSGLREERNGASSLSTVNTNGAVPVLDVGRFYYLGRQGSDYFKGRISELLVFNTALTPTEQERLDSYLAVKYGISLGQNDGAQNYVSSTGSVIWDATVVGNYNKDITAIGQDDASELDQTQSESSNHETLVTISESGGGMSDGEFLFWSNDGGSRAFETLEVPSGITHRLGREWLVEETGEVGSVDLSFDLTGISIPAGVDAAGDFFLLHDIDDDFAVGSVLVSASSFTGTVVTFTGLSESVLNDGTYFTLGATVLNAPAEVSIGIELWLKADAGTSTTTDGEALASWSDQSGRGNDGSESNSLLQPKYRNVDGQSINFYPTIAFDGSEDQLLNSLSALEGSNNYSIIAVGIREDGSVNPVVGSDLAKEAFFYGYNSSQEFGFRALEGGSSISFSSTPSAFDMPGLTPFLLSGINSELREERNGATSLSGVNANGAFPGVGQFYLGRQGSDYFKGRISELLVFSTALNPTEQAQLNSYLAIKYGISLGQNDGAQSYVSSTGAVIWDATVVGNYNKDITAIGQDDRSELDQTQSKSTNHESLVTIVENGGGMSDGEFLFWSNDGGSRDFETSELPSRITHRLGREWLVQETGEVGSVDLSFDLTGISIPAGVDLTDEFSLLYDGDGDFSSGSSRVSASSFTGTVVTFTGLPESVLNDGTYFTLGAITLNAPAGVSSSGIDLWLKADSGTSTTTDAVALASWSDQSGRGSVFSAISTTSRPVYQNNDSDNINFNPTIAFDGSNDGLIAFLGDLEGINNYSILAVGIREDGSVNPVMGSDLAKEAFFYGYNSSHEFGFRALAGGSSIDFSHSPSAFDMPGLTPFLLSGINSELSEERNGASSLSTVNTNGVFPDNIFLYLGRQKSDYFKGRISEVLVFSTALTSTEQERLNSYLAVKYGISLGQNQGAQNYVSSTGAVIWNATVAGDYDKDITAIGQDDGSELDQTQSKSTNHESLVTIAENGGGMSDGEFLFWSNDGGSRAFETTELPSSSFVPQATAGVTHRLGREWLVKETGEVGSVDLSFDLTGISIPAGVDLAEEFLLLYDGDGDFSIGSSQIRASSFTGTVVTFTGLSESVLNDGTYFTLGATVLSAPAGISSTGIELWLKADAGLAPIIIDGLGVGTWSDQSGRGTYAIQGNANLTPVYQDNDNANINFHPTIAFDGSNDQLLSSLSALEGSSNYSIIAVGIRADGSVNPVMGSDLAKEAFFYGYNSSQEFGFRALEGGSSIDFSNSPSAYDMPGLTPFLLSGINSELREERNGATSLSAVNTNGTFPNVGQFYLGRQGTEYFNGRLSELLVFRRALNATEQAQLSSYLAMKNGISLGQNQGAQNYVSSTGAVIWDAGAAGSFYRDITAIGQDDGSELDQTQSRSTNHESLVTIAENGGGMNDGEFLFWSNHRGSRAFARAFVTTALPSGITHRLAREWLVQETGEVGSVDLSFDLTGISLPAGVDAAGDLFLLYDEDEIISSSSSQIRASSFTGTVVTFTGLSESVLNDGTHFTLGATAVLAPAGLSASVIELWLKADTGTSTTTDGTALSSWIDQSGEVSDVSVFSTSSPLSSPVYKNNDSDNINFNPTIAFDGSDDQLYNFYGSLDGINNYSILAVGIREDGSVNPVLGAALATKETFFFGYNSSHEFGFRALAGGSSIDFGDSPSAFDMPDYTPFLLSGINSELREERNGVTSLSTENTNGVFPIAFLLYVGSQGSDYFKGRISEVLAFSKALTSTEQERLNSYLAVKYGISLGQNQGAQNYVSSTGAVIWDATVVGNYNKDITAIGQDDGSGLDQTQSKSTNHETLVTIVENGGGMNDGEFLFWSNDGGSRAFVTTEVPSGITHRLGREWLVEETGEVGSVDLSFDLTGVTIPGGATASKFWLILDDNGDFTNGSSAASATSYSNSAVGFVGLHEDLLDEGAYFTLGYFDNNDPVAKADTLMRKPGTGVVKILVSDLLSNDSDADGDSFSFQAGTLPAVSTNGSSLSVLSGGRWILYTPSEASPATDDTFTYRIVDEHGFVGNGTVTLRVELPTRQTANNTRASVAGNDVDVEFLGIPGRKYKIQSTTSLGGVVIWTDESGVITADGRGLLKLRDLDAAVTQGSKFYRTVEVNE